MFNLNSAQKVKAKGACGQQWRFVKAAVYSNPMRSDGRAGNTIIDLPGNKTREANIGLTLNMLSTTTVVFNHFVLLAS